MKRTAFALTVIVTLLLSMSTIVNLFRVVDGNPSTRGIAKVPDPLIVEIKSPFNKTYNTNFIQLNLTAQIPGPYTCEYSVDNGPFINTPLTRPNPIFGGEVDKSILLNLADGSHTIVAKAGYAVACVSFTINTVPPYLSIMIPENITHDHLDIPLEYMVAGYSHVSYSLDGKANVTMTGNSTLRGIIDGAHNLVLFGTSLDGIAFASEPVFFGVNTGLPEIVILSIKNNTTYHAYDLDLIFYLSEPSPEIKYGFWGQSEPFTVITGNVTMTNLPSGLYRLVLYAKDSLTDDNSVREVFFGIENPFPTAFVLASVLVVAVISIGLLVYFKKRKH